MSIFRSSDLAEIIIALVEVYLDVGWHPDQPSPQSKTQRWVLGCISHDIPAIHFLVERAPGLRLDSRNSLMTDAVTTLDTEFLDFLAPHGADPTVGTPLFSLIKRYPAEAEKAMHARDAEDGATDILPSVPFSRRRPTAG